MTIHETRRAAFVHLLLCGEIDSHEAAILSDALRRHIDAGDVRIVLEFGNRAFLSSAIIGLLISLQRLVLMSDGEIVLVRAPRLLRRSLGSLGVHSLFRMEESVAAALGEATPA